MRKENFWAAWRREIIKNKMLASYRAKIDGYWEYFEDKNTAEYQYEIRYEAYGIHTGENPRRSCWSPPERYFFENDPDSTGYSDLWNHQ